uniref:Apoptotic chromatin condensation inducer 1b n=2 Tax=Myripristis murdjan TaxID=586833 RepID=A0A667YYN5_9TELE
MSQNSFIKQYLAKQQELLRQRLEREAQQAAEADESPAAPEDDEDHSEDNDSSSYITDKHCVMPSQPLLNRAAEEGGGGPVMGPGMMACRSDMGAGSTHHLEAPGVWMQRSTIQSGHEEPPTPSPPRAVASLSVRVLGQPDRQGLPPAVPRAQEKEGTAPVEPGSAHPVLHLSRSAGDSAGAHIHDDSDEDDDDESEEDEDWGPSPSRARRVSRAPAQPLQPSPSIPSAAARSRRKLQPPQHIPPLQVHQPPMQLRHPTPPPSPPPELSFPLPDTPKQSPPDTDEPEGEMPLAASYPPPAMQRQDSDSSSRSSSPEPPQQRRPGPLSLLARKMESEGALPAAKSTLVMGMSGEVACSSSLHAISIGAAGSSKSPLQRMERERQQERREEEEERRLKEKKEKEQRQEEEREQRRKQEEERERKRLEEEKERERKQLEEKKRRLEEEREKERKRQEEEKRREEKRLEEERERRREAEEKGREGRLPPWKRGQEQMSQSKAGSQESAMEQGAAVSSQHSKRSVLVRDASPQKLLSSPPIKTAPASVSPTAKRPRMFSDTPAGPTASEFGSVVVSKAQDSGSSSDSDSKSDSSSRSSQSSSSSWDKPRPAREPQKANKGQGAEKNSSVDKGAERRYPTKREVSEPSAAAVTEVDPDSENSMSQQPASEAEPDNNSESRLEESTTPKAFAARKISLTSSKTSPASTEGGTAGAGESETGTAAGRKRRWGSSTSVTAKKPSISITTDSLKSLIPDIKVSQEAVVELHPEELQLSGDEEGLDTSRDDQDKGLKIRRTVTQVVPGDSQENGQGNEEEDDVEKMEKEKQRRTSKDKRKNSHSEETLETQTSVKHDAEAKKVTPSDSLVRRSISQQKSGVSITIDDPVRTTRQPSPPRGKVSNIIHVTNLVRPFTLGQLKELLNRTGSVVEEGFWIDKIKSHCYVTYLTTEEAVATRAALHGVKWPQSNPKVLSVDFCEQDELDFHKGLLKPDRGEEDPGVQPGVPQTRLPPLMPERDRDRERDRERERERDRGMGGVRDQWAEREREMERRERARGEREWDRDKIREFGRPGEESRRSRSRDRERRRRERGKSKERRSDKKEKDEPPAKLLDDLFLKTKAAPCIYWLPLTEEQAAQRVLDRAERQKERERKRKEQQEEEDKKREEEKKERLKGREKEGGVTASSGGAGRGDGGDRERDRGRDRDRDGEKKRDGYRPRRPSGGVGSGRRSRSRSNPRDRRR